VTQRHSRFISSRLRLASPLIAVVAAASSADEAPVGPYARSGHEFAAGFILQKAESAIVSRVGELPEVGLDLSDFAIEDEQDSWYLEYRWRARPRWVISAFAYQYKDRGSVISDFDFNFDGVEYEAGARIDGELEIETYVLDVLYSAYQGERAELLVGGGVHALTMRAAFDASLSVDEATATASRASDTLLAPVPNLRVQGTYAFSDRFGMDLTAGWLSADVDDYDGSFLYVNARLRYRFWSRASVALGYQFTRIDVTEQAGDQHKREFDADLYGPSLQLTYAF
jgi:hypothetical protein